MANTHVYSRTTGISDSQQTTVKILPSSFSQLRKLSCYASGLAHGMEYKDFRKMEHYTLEILTESTLATGFTFTVPLYWQT
jgi:hypothetical protein